MVTAAEILARLEPQLPLVEDPADALARGSAPAELFRVAGTEHCVGIIAAVYEALLRRPATGCGSPPTARSARACSPATESDLRGPLRAGADDGEIADRWVVAVAGKQAGHGIDDPTFLQPDRPMSAIGG